MGQTAASVGMAESVEAPWGDGESTGFDDSTRAWLSGREAGRYLWNGVAANVRDGTINPGRGLPAAANENIIRLPNLPYAGPPPGRRNSVGESESQEAAVR